MMLKDKIKDDPRLASIEVNDQNALVLARYLDELDNCAKCKSLDNCPNAFMGMEPFLISNDEVGKRPCPKMAAKMRKNNVDSRYAGNYLKDADFAKFIIKNEANGKALEYAQRFIAGKETKGLYIHGPFATGKTYFLSALASALADVDKKTIFIFVPDLPRELKNAISDNSLEARIEDIKNVDVLILDDLGGEMMSGWFRDEILMPILQYRIVNKKPIFISSNLNYDELEKHLAMTKEEVDGIKANRIKERIKQMTKRVAF